MSSFNCTRWTSRGHRRVGAVAGVLKYEREHIALVQAGSRVYVSSARTLCRTHKFAQAAELATVVKGHFVTRCGAIAVPLTASSSPDC